MPLIRDTVRAPPHDGGHKDMKKTLLVAVAMLTLLAACGKEKGTVDLTTTGSPGAATSAAPGASSAPATTSKAGGTTSKSGGTTGPSSSGGTTGNTSSGP